MSRLGASLLLAACLFVGPAGAQPPPDSADVVINEIQYAPSPSTNEYIELYNRSSVAVALNSLEYADANGDFSPVTSRDTLLAPGDYVVLVRDSAAFAAAFPSAEFLTPSGWQALNNGGDTVQLQHGPTGTTIDAVPFAPSWGGSDGAALERIDPAGPSTASRNFGTSTAPAGGTPAAENSLYAPDTTAPTLTQVTPTPNGDTLTARFSESVDPSTVSPNAFQLRSPDAPSIVSVRVSEDASAVVRGALGTSLSEGAYTLEANNIADLRGNVRPQSQASFSYVETSVPAAHDVIVNEIQYAPPAGRTEFIELYNRSEKTVNLGALAVADANGDFVPVARSRRALRPDSFAVVVRDSASFAAAYPNVPFRAPREWAALNNGGDVVQLRHTPTDTQIDRVPYEPDWGGESAASLERIDPAAPSSAASTFASSIAPVGATPGQQNSVYAPDRSPPSIAFAEETAENDAAVHFSEPVAPGSISPGAFAVGSQRPTTATLRHDSVAVLTLPGAPEASTIRVEGVMDRVGNRLQTAQRPLALQPDSGQVVVNELMYAPRADDFDDRPNQVEYLELRNRTDRLLTLKGLQLTDRPTEEGVADTIRAGRLRGLPPQGYAVIAAAPNAPSPPSESQLAAAFPSAPVPSDSVAFLPVDAASLGLRNDGDLVRIHRADTAVVARVAYRPDWHAPALEDPTGTALERISPGARASAPDNWSSSTAPAGGTPGTPNSLTSAVSGEDAPAAGLTITPSPFSIERDGATRIQYQLQGAPSLVRVQIYDARGRKVRTLEDARLTGRSGTLVWNGRDGAGNRVRIGVYVVLFEAVRSGEGTVARFKEPVVVARPLN